MFGVKVLFPGASKVVVSHLLMPTRALLSDLAYIRRQFIELLSMYNRFQDISLWQLTQYVLKREHVQSGR